MKKDLTMSLRMEKDNIIGHLNSLKEKVTLLHDEIELLSSQLVHINALLEASDGKSDGSSTPPAPFLQETHAEIDPIEIAWKILDERVGEPIHYRDLASLVIQNGGDLPGQDPASTLVSRLVRDERFVRPFRRGWYALRVHHSKVRSVGQRLKPSRRRR